MTDEEIKKKAEERFGKHCAEDYCYPSRSDLEIYKDGYKDGCENGITTICKKILEEVENYNDTCADIEECGIYIEPLENIMKKLGVNLDD